MVKEVSEKKSKIWLGKDGIIYVNVFGGFGKEQGFELIDKALELAKECPGKIKVLAILENISPKNIGKELFGSSSWRKELADRLVEVYRDQGFEKIAIYTPNTTVRTVTYFVMKATGLHSIEVFKTKDEALKWLKGS